MSNSSPYTTPVSSRSSSPIPTPTSSHSSISLGAGSAARVDRLTHNDWQINLQNVFNRKVQNTFTHDTTVPAANPAAVDTFATEAFNFLYSIQFSKDANKPLTSVSELATLYTRIKKEVPSLALVEPKDIRSDARDNYHKKLSLVASLFADSLEENPVALAQRIKFLEDEQIPNDIESQTKTYNTKKIALTICIIACICGPIIALTIFAAIRNSP